MNKLHDADLSKIRIIIGYILSGIACLLILFSATMKLIGDEFIIQSMAEINLLSNIKLIAAVEIICILLYWIPKTMNLGFFLLCSLVGGIIVAEWIALEGVGLPVPGVPLAVILYVGTFLRKKSLSGLNI